MSSDTAMGRLTDTDPELRRDTTYRMSVPLGRTGNVEDATNAVVFLASDASAYVTGSTLVLDGGTLAISGWFSWPGYGISNFVPELARRLRSWQDVC